MAQRMVIVNASTLLTDEQVKAWVGPLQKQATEFRAAWGKEAAELELSFCPMSQIPDLLPGDWPIFLNKHSKDAGDAGWHTKEGSRVYGRVFVGDCLLAGIQVSSDLSHEVVETQLDPTADKTYKMGDGRLAALESADAVEADASGYYEDGVLLSNYVLPDYFSDREDGKYDRQGYLKEPCPALLPGGYMDISRGSAWETVQMDRHDGLPGRRFILPRFRRWRRREVA